MRTRRILAAGLILLAAAPAQNPPGNGSAKAAAEKAAKTGAVDQLERLLTELGKTDAKTWKTRLRAMEGQAAQLEKRARALRSEAELTAKKATAARREIERFKKLMAILAHQKPAPKTPTPKKPAPKKTAPKKPAPKKTAPKKTAPKSTKKPPPKPAKSAKRKGPPQMAAAPGPAKKNTDFVTYDTHVQDIFMDNCSACHDDAERSGGLDLTSFATARAGGSSGTTIIPGDIDRSRLYQLVAHLKKPTMPPDEEPIAAEKIDLIRRWIEAGAPENLSDAAAFQAKTAQLQKAQAASLVSDFEGPAPMPEGWPEVEPAKPNTPVSVTSLAASARSPILALPGLSQVLVLDSNDHGRIGVLPFEGDVAVLAFSHDASQILAAGGIPGRRGRAVLYDVSTGTVRGQFGKEFDTVLAAAVHPGLSHVAIGGSSRKVRVYETGSNGLAYELTDHREWILSLDFSADGKTLASADRAGVVVLTQARSGRNVETIRRHRGAVHHVRFAPSGRTLATTGDDGTVRLFDAKNGRQLWSRSLGGRGLALAFSPDGKHIAVGGQDGRARVLRSGNGTVAGTFEAVGDWIYSLAIDETGRKLFVGDWSGTTTVFDRKSRKRVARFVATAPRDQLR